MLQSWGKKHHGLCVHGL